MMSSPMINGKTGEFVDEFTYAECDSIKSIEVSGFDCRGFGYSGHNTIDYVIRINHSLLFLKI